MKRITVGSGNEMPARRPPIPPIRLAVLSHPCFRAINRRVYAVLAEGGFDVLIVAPQSMRGEAPDPPRAGDPPVHFLPLTTWNPRTYRFAGAEAILEAFRPDIVLVDADPASLIALRTGIWCRRHGARMACLTAENLDFRFFPHIRRVGLRSIPQAAAKALLHACTRPLVDHIFTINHSGTALYRNAGYARVTQVPLGFDPNVFHSNPAARASVRSALGISPATVVLAFFGRATRQKGLHHIIEALGHIEARAPGLDWHLLLNEFQTHPVYSRELKEQIEQAGLGRRITSFAANHEEVSRYMAAADAVVLASLSQPSLVEQFGRVISEAMACGVLAIVSDSGQPSKLVSGFGLVFPQGDVERLAALLSDVITSPQSYRALAEEGMRHARANLSVDKQAELMRQSLCGHSIGPAA